MLGGSYASRHEPKEMGIFIDWTPDLDGFILTWKSDDPSRQAPQLLRYLDLELAEAIYITTAHELAQYSWRLPDSKPDCLILVLLWPHLELFVIAPTELVIQ